MVAVWNLNLSHSLFLVFGIFLFQCALLLEFDRNPLLIVQITVDFTDLRKTLQNGNVSNSTCTATFAQLEE